MLLYRTVRKFDTFTRGTFLSFYFSDIQQDFGALTGLLEPGGGGEGGGGAEWASLTAITLSGQWLITLTINTPKQNAVI